jgi:hypothetical protein
VKSVITWSTDLMQESNICLENNHSVVVFEMLTKYIYGTSILCGICFNYFRCLGMGAVVINLEITCGATRKDRKSNYSNVYLVADSYLPDFILQ